MRLRGGMELELHAFLKLALDYVDRSVSNYGRFTAMDRALGIHGLGTWWIPESDWTLGERKCFDPSRNWPLRIALSLYLLSYSYSFIRCEFRMFSGTSYRNMKLSYET